MKARIYIILFIFASTFRLGYSQFDSHTPYSYYGLGDLTFNSLQNGFAMGGVAQGLRDSCYINPLNPASYASLDVTQLNFGFEGNFLSRDQGGLSYRNNNVFINQFSLGIPIMHKRQFFQWGMFVGYSPYSFVGYNLQDTSTVVLTTDTVLAQYNYYGTGGLNRVSWGNGFQLGGHFALGFNLHYTFGVSNRFRTVQIPSDEGYLSTRVEEKTSIGNLSFDVGFQSMFTFRVKRYKLPRRVVIAADTLRGIKRHVSILPDSLRDDNGMPDAHYKFVIGGTYNYGSSFNAGFDQVGVQYFAGSIGVDTFLLNPSGKGTVTFPHGFGAGIALTNPGIWTLAADFNYKLWSGFYYFDQPTLVYNDSYSAHLGFEYTPYFNDKLTRQKGRFLRNIAYRFGARYYNRYYRPDGNPIDEYAFSFGLGLPFGFDKFYDEDLRQKVIVSFVNIGVEGGFANSRNGGVVNESFVRFMVSITLRDKWFTKLKYN